MIRIEPVVQRIYVKINPENEKVMISCDKLPEENQEGWSVVYVSNYPATQQQLRRDYESKLANGKN